MMPGMAKMGVSRKIEDEQERRRLRQILDSLEPPKDVGFIIRTAGIGKSKAEILRDLNYLTRLWTTLVKKRDGGPGPMELYTEGDLVTRTVRDVITSDVDRIIIDSKDVASRVKEVFKLANPRARNIVELYDEPVPLFHKFGIEAEIEQMYSRYVPLPSGGSLVIDSTEAVVAIDVNSGKSRDHSDAETTAFKTDLEAADEIPRQLRLRDLGGVIICDFIDLRYERHQRELERRLHDNLQNDRAKTKVLRMSQFGIIEMTRQRMRPSLKRSIYSDCPHCRGAGLVKTPESMGLDVMRRLRIAANDQRVARIELKISPDVAFFLQNRKRGQVADLEHYFGKTIIMRADANLGLDEMKLELFDTRDGLVYLEELGLVPPPAPGSPEARGHVGQGRSRFDQRRGQPVRQPPRGQSRPPQPARPEMRDNESDYDREMDTAEDEIDRREEGDDEPQQNANRPEPDMGEEDREGERDDDRDDQRRGGREAPPQESGDRRDRNFDNRSGPQQRPIDGQGGRADGEMGERTGRPRRRRGRRGRGRGRGGEGGGQRDSFNDRQPVPPGQPPEFRDDEREAPLEPTEESWSDVREDRAGLPADDIGPAPTEMESTGAADASAESAEREVRSARPERARDESSMENVSELEVDDADLSGGNVIAPEPTPQADVDGNQPPKRRPSRGRKPKATRSRSARAPASEEPSAEEAPAAAAKDEETPAAEETKAPRRRTRGGRGRRRGGGSGGAANDRAGGEEGSSSSAAAGQPDEPKSASRGESAAVASGEHPSAREPRAAEASQHVKTGSTDRHLAGDEPIAPQPVVRPRSYRDLDAIPDDDY
jgi:Rne/Rng family ribonuclease